MLGEKINSAKKQLASEMKMPTHSREIQPIFDIKQFLKKEVAGL